MRTGALDDDEGHGQEEADGLIGPSAFIVESAMNTVSCDGHCARRAAWKVEEDEVIIVDFAVFLHRVSPIISHRWDAHEWSGNVAAGWP